MSKLIFLGGTLKTIDKMAARPIMHDEHLDVAILQVKDIRLERCLPYTCLKFETAPPEMLCIMGFLGRDFKRSKADSTLRPKPYLFTGTTKHLDSERVGISHQRRGRATATGTVEMAPIPRGLSGTMMVSSTGLLRNKVEIFGVFTEERLEHGYIFGSHINALLPLLDKLD